MNNDARKYFYSKFPREGKGDGIIKEIKEEMKNIEKEADLEKRHREAFFSWKKHNAEFNALLGCFNDYVVEDGISRVETIDKYKELIDKLEKLRGETYDEINKKLKNYQPSQSSQCSYCKLTPPAKHYIYSSKNDQLKATKKNSSKGNEWIFCSESHFEKWHKKNYFCCAECNKKCYDGKSKKDNQKFCSSDCFYKHYAERCDECLEKCVISYKGKATGFSKTYYQDVENKTGTLCSKCHQEKLKDVAEEKRKDKEWEESCKKLDKNMDDLVDGMVEAVSGNDEDNSKENNSNVDDKSNQIKSNQIKSNLQYFVSNFISSVELTEEGGLKVNYSNKSPDVLKSSDLSSNSFYSKMKENMEKEGVKKLIKEDLEKQKRKLGEKNQEQKPTKDKLWGLIIGGSLIGIVTLVGLVMVAKVRKNRRRH